MVISTKVRSWYLVPKWLLFLNQWWEWYFSPLHTTRCYGVSNSEKSFQYVGEPDSSARAYKYFTQNRHSHVHIYRHTHAHAHTCTHIQAHTRTHTQTHTCTHIEAHTHTHVHTHTGTHAHTGTHTHMYKHTSTHTHPHIHARYSLVQAAVCPCLC
jgi:hypothetical protein